MNRAGDAVSPAVVMILLAIPVSWAGPPAAPQPAAASQEPRGQKEGEEGDTDEDSAPALSQLVVRVRGLDAGKLVGARVDLNGAGSHSQTTGADGRATFTSLEQGKEVSITVSAEGWQPHRESLRLDDESEQTTIELSPRATRLTVTVAGVDADGEETAIPTCTISVSRRGQTLDQRTTNEPCTAVFEEVSAGKVKITVVAQGFETGLARKSMADAPVEVAIEIRKLAPPG